MTECQLSLFLGLPDREARHLEARANEKGPRGRSPGGPSLYVQRRRIRFR